MRAFLQKTLPKRRFVAATRVLRPGQVLDLEKTMSAWQQIGYETGSVVESSGQFSRRGGIIDIFPAAADMPVRIELFGNEIESIRYFDPTTQRSLGASEELGSPDEIVITPAREVLPGIAQESVEVWADLPLPAENSLPSWRNDLSHLRAGEPFPNLEYYLPVVYHQPVTLLDYLPPETLILIDDWLELKEAARELLDHARQIAEEQSDLPPGYQNPLFTWDEVASEIAWWQPLVLGEGQPDGTAVEEEPVYLELGDAFDPGPRYGGQVRPFMNQLKQTRHEGERVVVLSRQAARLAELWSQTADRLVTTLDALEQEISPEANGPAAPATPAKAGSGVTLESMPTTPPQGSLSFVQGSLAEGFILVDRRHSRVLLHLLTDAEIFGWSRPAPRRQRSARPAAPETFFADIKQGDYVVHLDYGIGRFEGLVVRYLGGMEREYLLVTYANGDTLYVPVHHADRLGKWIGPDGVDPALNRLGDRSWHQSKAAAQRSADELAQELLDLYAARETIAGHAFPPDSEWQAELEAAFPYQETEDQLRVIHEVKQDMEQAAPMDRLICGDVGYGKTEVALRAAFKAVLDGKQVAMLVPTTILAQQHYTTFRERLTPFPVKVEMLSRFRTPARQRQITRQLRDGQIDIVIATHRLLSDDVAFKDLGLVIIDEEQRFGVAAKEKLKQWRTEVDVLTLTATPIPRTLHMALTGVRDISIIDTAPAERLPVETYVGEIDDFHLRTAILRELDRGGQIFFVHNRVQSIHIVRKKLEKLVPDAKVVVAHGQMSERKLEQIMVEFAEGRIDIYDTGVLGDDVPEWGQVDKRAGEAAVAAIEVATKAAMEQRVAGIVTGPINKEAIWAAGSEHLGHTEMLGALTGVTKQDTMFVVRNAAAEGHHLRIFFTTRHVSLRTALDQITKDRVLDSIHKAHTALTVFGVEKPRLAVAAINPHGGENGAFGDEEIVHIGPACEAARADVQHWRAQSSAVLTSAATVLADDPRLTVRLESEVSRIVIRNGAAEGVARL